MKLKSKKENTNSLFSVSHDLKVLGVISGVSGQGQSHAGQPLALFQQGNTSPFPYITFFCSMVF